MDDRLDVLIGIATDIRWMCFWLMICVVITFFVSMWALVAVNTIGKSYNELIKILKKAQADNEENWGESDEYGSLGDPT